MKRKTKVAVLWGIFGIGVLWLGAACTPSDDTPKPTPIMVWEFKNKVSFDTVYPEGWEQSLIRVGFLVFAPPNVAYDSEAGPTMSIIREPPLGVLDSLEEELNHFLEFGPLREDYFLSSDINPVKIGQYDGIEVAVEREENDIYLAMKSVISVVRTESGSLYTFIATAPTEQWAESWPLLLAISQNVTFNE